ncbi:MAG TPA: hypothetical protein VFL56_05920, partial [Solirubrobacterales bacterium]|nr:hypothetical protein [Solirubrobacterales bacterium]
MSFGAYLGGVVGLAAVAIPTGLAAVRLRARLLPGWEGAPARLAEAVLGASVLTILLQALGAIGVLVPAVLIVAALAVGLTIRFGPWLRPVDAEGEAPPAPPIPRLETVVALAAAAFVAAHWATGLQDVWARGMLTFDTLWYHGPFAARIAEEGSVWAMHFTDPLYLNWFYPENSELHHGAGIVLFDRDVFSPLINFGWLGVTFLAAWCVGRPYRVAPLSLAAVAIVMDTGPMVPREAGTAATDTAPVALLLAAAAILINAWAGRSAAAGEGVSEARTSAGAGRASETSAVGGALGGALLIAGLAVGIAVGTKLTVSGAAAVMTAGAPFLVPPGARRRAFLVFL